MTLLSELEEPFEDPGDPLRKRAGLGDVQRRARAAVRAALKSGKLYAEPCQQILRINGQDVRCCAIPTEAHHLSYEEADWLKVTWLCKRHHAPRQETK